MIFNDFSPTVAMIFAQSREEALAHNNKYISSEHLLLAILHVFSNEASALLDKIGGSINEMTTRLEAIMEEQRTTVQPSPEVIAMNLKASNIVRQAVVEAHMQQQKTVEVNHLIQAMLHDSINDEVKTILNEQHISYDLMKNYFAKMAGNEPIAPQDNNDIDEDDDLFNPDTSSRQANAGRQATQQARQTKAESDTPVLDRFSVDLTRAAAEGKLDPVVGREKEILRLIEIIGRRKKNNPILIGEPGVGKTAIVEGLAQRIANRQTSPMLFGKRLVSLDMAGMVAGTKYRGQFEERIKALVNELQSRPDIIVFIDEIHTMVGAGGAPGSMDAANMLKPALARGTIQCIGSTTLDEYRNSIEKDGALERRFQKVIVEENTPDETLQILQNIKGRYEQHHHVTYSAEALKACVELTQRYISDRRFPDKAIDAMDEAGSKVRLKAAKIPQEYIDKEIQLKQAIENEKQAVASQNYELAAAHRDRQAELSRELSAWSRQWEADESNWQETVESEDVANVVSLMSGVPVQRVAEAENQRLRKMPERLKQAVIGQDAAIDKLSKAIQRNRIGLKEAHHPIAAFMFLGPTGVGKTYLAKKLAEEMFGSEDALIRIDMSEYAESFNTSRLVGAPPGYVGYEEGGQLTEQVRRKPYSIVLLDEIEKAHGNVFNMLLQVLDEGRLTDGNGRLVDFQNTVIIMTSNAGTRQLKEFGRGIGFNTGATLGNDGAEQDKAYARSIIQKALSKQFAPEFINRLDDIITFDALNAEAIGQIVKVELRTVERQVAEMGYSLNVTPAAQTFIASKGFDPQYGARPLKRAIQTYVVDAICEELLNQDIPSGATITIGKSAGEDKINIRWKENDGDKQI